MLRVVNTTDVKQFTKTTVLVAPMDPAEAFNNESQD